MENVKRHLGSCHCGAVKYAVSFGPSAMMTSCNCTVCAKIGAISTIVKPDAFELLSGQDSLGTYEWGAKISRRHYCTKCGVHCFGRGFLEQVGGEFASVNCRTLDDLDVSTLTVVHWDGRHDNWQSGPRPTPWAW